MLEYRYATIFAIFSSQQILLIEMLKDMPEFA